MLLFAVGSTEFSTAVDSFWLVFFRVVFLDFRVTVLRVGVVGPGVRGRRRTTTRLGLLLVSGGVFLEMAAVEASEGELVGGGILGGMIVFPVVAIKQKSVCNNG